MKKYFKEGYGIYGDEIGTLIQENADGVHTDVYKMVEYGEPDYSKYYTFEVAFTNIEHMCCDLLDSMIEDYIDDELALIIVAKIIQGNAPKECDIRIGCVTTHYKVESILFTEDITLS